MIKTDDKAYKRILFLLVLGAVLAGIKGIFTDFDVDCEYAIAMSYRMARGDKMFSQMWEPHQTSAFLNAALIRLYLWLTRSTTGMVLYLNLAGLLAKAGVAFFFYRTFRKSWDKEILFFACIFFFIVNAKDYLILDFSNMQIYFSILLFCSLFRYLQEEESLPWLFVSAALLCLQCLSYPTCVLNYIVVMVLLYRTSRRRWRDILTVSGICLGAGSAYLLFFLSRYGLADFLSCVREIVTGDGSHQMSLYEKAGLYFRDFRQIFLLLIICAVLSFLIVFPAEHILQKKPSPVDHREKYVLVFFALLFLENVISVLFAWEWFKLYLTAYYAIFAAALLLAGRCTRQERQMFYAGISISGASCAAVMLLTNLSILLTTGYFILGIMVSMIPIGRALKQHFKDKRNAVKYGMILLFLFAALIRSGFGMFTMSRGGGLCTNILDIGGIVRNGPAAGILSDYMGTFIMNHNYDEWEEYVCPGDRILLVSSGDVNPLGYLFGDTIISVDSTICTPTYNEKLLRYWERNPDKLPNVVIVECWYGDLKLSSDDWIMKWTEENCTSYEDGTFLRFYRLD